MTNSPEKKDDIDDESQRLYQYALLASAIAGRQIIIKVSKNNACYTDAQTIFLAPTSNHKQRIQNVVIQAALLHYGSFDEEVVAQLAKQKDVVVGRYLSLEADRVAQLGKNFLPPWVVDVMALSRQGAKAKIDRKFEGELSDSAQSSLEQAIKNKSISQPTQALGTIYPWVLLKGVRAVNKAISEAELKTAEQFQHEPDQGEDDEDTDSDTSTSVLLKLMAGPTGGDNSASRLLRSLFGIDNNSEGSGKQGGDAGGELPAFGAKFSKRISAGAKVVADNLLNSLIGEPDRPESQEGATYPEWDYKKGAYLPHWSYITQWDINVSGAQIMSTPDLALRRRLARLGTTYQRHKRQHEGEELDMDSLIELAGDLLAGKSGDENIYEATRKTGRGLSVVVLLDASGSTGDQQIGGQQVWESQRKLAQSLISAFDVLGDTVSAYGFRSYGRNDVRFLRIKDFEQRFDQAAIARLHALKPGGFTRLGAAVRHAQYILSTKAATAHQLLIVVSDGLPYDIAYEDEYAEQDARHALEEAKKQGVACACISVGAPTEVELLDRVWGNVGHVNLSNPEELSRYALPLFQAALKSAASTY